MWERCRRWWPLLLVGVGAAGLGVLLRRSEAPESARVLWTFEPVERGAFVSAPLLARGRVYAAAIQDHAFHPAGTLYCLDQDTGKVVWKFNDDGEMLQTVSSPCIAGGRLYIGEGMHINFVCKLYCLDATDGRKQWEFATAGHIESSPYVSDGRVFFGSGDDGMYCLDAVSGKERWHLRGSHVDSSPAVAGKRVSAGSGVSRLYTKPAALCLDADTGDVVWQTPTRLPAWGSPRVDGGQVFFGLGNGRLNQSAQPPDTPAGALLCLDADTGREHWHVEVGDAVLDRPAVDAERVYFNSRDGHCYCLERASGRQVWKQTLGSPAVTNPALADGRLYVVASGGVVRCLDAGMGKVMWTLDLASHGHMRPQLLSSPALGSAPQGQRRIYFGAELQNPAGNAAVLYCLQEERP